MTGYGYRDTGRLNAAPRCGAKTRKCLPCRAPALQGKARCRMHGGNSPGAKPGNRHAFKSGLYTAEEIALRKAVMRLIREARATLEDMNA
jgi:hypothetical protein